MQFIDMHCDSLLVLYVRDAQKADLYESAVTSVDFSRMKKSGQLAQFFAVFLPTEKMYRIFGVNPVPDEVLISTLREYLLQNVKAHQNIISMAYSAKDIRRNQKAGKMSAVLTMEDGRAVGGKLENIKKFYDMGFRALSLTWNVYNCFGAPNSIDPKVMKDGLSRFGKEAVEYMQDLGMLVDVSHLSEGGFYDVADVCQKPFAATHSNCIALCPHQRNLTDDQLRILGRTGSVAGLNFGPEFLNPDTACKDSRAERIAKHARHMADVAGCESVGIGSDFDGISGNLEISDCSKMDLLESALQKEGFSGSEIEKIFYKNVLRVMQDSMR